MLPYCMMNILKTLPNVGLAAAFSRKGKGVDGFLNLMSEGRFPGFVDSVHYHGQGVTVISSEPTVIILMRQQAESPVQYPGCQTVFRLTALFFGQVVFFVSVFHGYNIYQMLPFVNTQNKKNYNSGHNR